MTPMRQTNVLLTEHAISNILEIETYSIGRWGKQTAEDYLKDIESGLQHIRQDPAILSRFQGLPQELQYHRANRHLLICDVRPNSIVVLTVIHASMDIPSRLAELLPKLSSEVARLHETLGSVM